MKRWTQADATFASPGVRASHAYGDRQRPAGWRDAPARRKHEESYWREQLRSQRAREDTLEADRREQAAWRRFFVEGGAADGLSVTVSAAPIRIATRRLVTV